jgi:hypothetical protein
VTHEKFAHSAAFDLSIFFLKRRNSSAGDKSPAYPKTEFFRSLLYGVQNLGTAL